MQLRQALLERGLATSAKQAEGFILSGKVLVNDCPATKPGTQVSSLDTLRVRGLKKYVSRAGEKLAAALDAFKIPVPGRSFLDIGASTGGFTDALLQHGARFVAAIDVGKGLLHQKLVVDERVQALSGHDFKSMEKEALKSPVEAFVADVSFTSLLPLLGKAFDFLEPGSRGKEGVVLFKPQFELAKDERYLLEKGVLRDRKHSAELLAAFTARAAQQGITIVQHIASPVKGAKGNQEYLLHLKKID